MARSGFSARAARQQLAVLAVDARDVRHHFQQPDHRQAGRIHHGPHAAARRRGPVQPKNSASGQSARNSSTTSEA